MGRKPERVDGHTITSGIFGSAYLRTQGEWADVNIEIIPEVDFHRVKTERVSGNLRSYCCRGLLSLIRADRQPHRTHPQDFNAPLRLFLRAEERAP